MFLNKCNLLEKKLEGGGNLKKVVAKFWEEVMMLGVLLNVSF